jgi:hypothetical protein
VQAVKSALKVLLAAIMTLALSLSLATAALAHGGEPDGHGAPEGPLGVLLIPPEFVLGGVAFFGVLYALKRRRG